jgi:integrase
MRYCKTPEGWRRYAAAFGRNGRVKPEWVKVKGKLVHYPEGRYEGRYYQGSKVCYFPAGDDAAEAYAACKKHEKTLLAREAAAQAGAKVVEEPSRVTLRRALDRFIQATKDKGAEVMAKECSRTCETFLTTLSPRRFVDELDQDDILRFYRKLRADGYVDRTIHNRHIHIAAFLRFAGVPAAVIPKAPKYEEVLPEVYSKTELDTFFGSLEPGSRDEVAYRMFQMLGLREGEAAHAEWSQVDFDRGVFRVRSNPRWGFKVKDKEQRDVTIPVELQTLLKAYRKGHKGSLIVGTDTDKPDGHLLRTLKGLAYKADLHCKTCDTCRERNECQHWYLHKFRANYATTLLRNGVDARTVMKLMGHSDLETVLQYLRPAEGQELVQKVNAVPW